MISDAYAHLTGEEDTIIKIAPDRWEDLRTNKKL